ncbi:MAG: hypothetical protein JKY87_00525 [Mariprofundus sp.]|nr:hypothetical protein [Mariprofundus sp.]
MSDFDRDLLLSAFLSKDEKDIQEAFASVDKEQVENDVVQALGNAFKPFMCTDDIMNYGSDRQVEEQDQELLAWLFNAIQGSKLEARRSLKLLQKLKKKYPKNPMFYNFTSVAYQTLGQDKKQLHTIKVTCKKFPNYLFGKIALANHHLLHKSHERISEIFDHKLQLDMHYPETEEMPTFHRSEIQAFYTVMGRYYARNQQIACALKCYFLVEEAGVCDHLKVLANEILVTEFAVVMKASIQNLPHIDELLDE